nr:anthrone oxygenase family protein [Flexivirga oryzae]
MAASVFGALTAGATAVVYLNFSARVMPSLGRMANAAGIARMQSFNRTAEQGPFMFCFFGAALAGGYLIYRFARGDRSTAGVLLAAGGAAYLLGFLLTMVYNVPLNDRLARLDPHAASSIGVWRDYLSGWTAANTVRAVLSGVATLLLVGGSVAAAQGRASGSAAPVTDPHRVSADVLR